MGQTQLIQDNTTGQYSLKMNLGKKEAVQTELIDYINNNQQTLTSVLPVLYNNQKKNRFLQVELLQMYSIAVRLQDPVSSSELILLLKGIIDSLGLITMQNISTNFVDLSLDRAFITKEGTIKWIIWGTSFDNEQTVLDLFYNIAQQAQPRTQTDATFLNEYNTIFQMQYPDMNIYLQNIDNFIQSNYMGLENALITKYKNKGMKVELTEAQTKVELDRLQIELQNKDLELNRLKNTVVELEEKLNNVDLDNMTFTPPPTEADFEILKEKDDQTEAAKEEVIREEFEEEAEPKQEVQPKKEVQQQQTTSNAGLSEEAIQQLVAQSVAAALQQVGVQSSGVQQPQATQSSSQVQQKTEAVEEPMTSVLVEDIYTEEDKQRLQEQAQSNDVYQAVSDTTVLIDDDNDNEVDTKVPYLVRLSNGEATPLKVGESIVGRRRSTSDIFISNNNAVSTQHAVINYNPINDTISVVDESKNGTWVNGERVALNLERAINKGDIISFANEEYQLEYREEV